MENSVKLFARPAKDGHVEVREIIDSGLAELKEWLDLRLQKQEELLRCLSNCQEFSSSQQHPKGTDVRDSRCSPSKVLANASQTASPSQPLRTATSFIEPQKCISDDSIEIMSLPGSATQGSSEQLFQPSAVWGEAVPAPDVNGIKRQTTTRYSARNSLRTLVSSAEKLDHDWQTKLMDIFDQLDLDRSGSIDRVEFMEAFLEAGMPNVQAFEVFRDLDKSANGSIDRVEWLHLIEEAATATEDEINLLIEFLDRLAELQRTRGRIYEHERKRRPCCILRHDSPPRVAWDLFLTLLLFYVSLSVPFTLGFGQDTALERIDQVTDMIFCIDVLLNFRTTYLDCDDTVIVDGKRIACKYLRSWFFLDFFSSVPFELITGGLLPNLTPARLLKIGKIAKVMKLLRINKMMSVLQQSELLEKFDQKIQSRGHQTVARIVKLAIIAFFTAHWLACFGNAVDGTALDVYFTEPEKPNVPQKYLAGIYWAMTTLSTVGYGDITPKTDEERAYAIVAMVIGGSLYGYVIGSVTSVVTDMDVGTHAYHERMELVNSWLDRHSEIPKLLRRRVRKHFKKSLASKSVMDDSAVIGELSPELRADTAFFLTHAQVRSHPMFSNIPNSALAKIVEVLHKNHANQEEYIVKTGDPGIAMYILVSGLARYDQGHKWVPPEMSTSSKSSKFQRVAEGDSFGEEIIFGLAETYEYTVMTLQDCEFHSISEDGFEKGFQSLPELRQEMLEAYLSSMGARNGRKLLPCQDIQDTIERTDTADSRKELSEKYHSVLPESTPVMDV